MRLRTAPDNLNGLRLCMAAAAAALIQRHRGHLRWGWQRAGVCVVIATVLTSTVMTATHALLSDEVTAAQISVTGGTVYKPTGLGLANQPAGVRLSWNAPATGIPPQKYDVFRSVTSGSYGGALAMPAGSPWTDGTVADCTTYYYKLRSRHTNLVSATTGEATVFADLAAPTVTDSAIVAASGPAQTAGFVKPGGQYYVAATISDNCTAGAALAVTVDLSNLGNSPAAAATFGSYTYAGTAYNFSAGPFTASGALSDGTTPSWTISIDDQHGYAPTVSGAAVSVDGVGPVAAKSPQVASNATDYYAPEINHGEVSAGTSFRVYADFTDAGSGVASNNSAVTADVSSIRAGETALNMPQGAFSTDNAVPWTHRSGGRNADAGLSEGMYSFSVTATDNVGNTTTANHQLEIDNTGLSLTGCTATNGNGTLAANDTNVFTFDDTVDPGKVDNGWDGTASVTFNARLRNNAANDYFQFGGINLLKGNGSPTKGIDLGATSWTTSNWSTSLLSRTAPNVFTTQYSGGSNSAVAATTATVHLRATQQDAAGNAILTTTAACSSAY